MHNKRQCTEKAAYKITSILLSHSFQASKNFDMLLDESHSWIFPQFSHPYWWKAEESNPNYYTIEHPQSHYSTECTDSQMAIALRSALFFGSPTYNNIPTDHENNNDTFYLVWFC